MPTPPGSQLRCTAIAGTVLLLALTAPIVRAQTGVYTQNGGTASKSDQTFTATLTDQSAVYALNAARLTLTNCTMQKTGDSSNNNNSSQYGINAAILATTASSVIVSGGSVTSNAAGANGLFATGPNTSVSMTGGAINTAGDLSHGVDVTYGGTITLNGVNITTAGSSSSALATDFGGGTVNVTGGTIIAASTSPNSHSAGIYSTGAITVNSATVSSLGDCGGVIDGSNAIYLNNTSLSGSVEGIKIWRTAPGSGTATVVLNGSSLTSSGGDGFYVTGSGVTAALTARAGALIHAQSGNIVDVLSSGVANFTVDGSTVTGNLAVDGTSALTATLQNSATLTGAAGGAAIAIDSSSHWNVLANSTLTVLTDPSGVSGLNITNITGNGFLVYYDSSLQGNGYLNGQTYALVNGGVLAPLGSTAVPPAISVDAQPGSLGQNQPNPFRRVTTIAYETRRESQVTLTVHDLAGRRIAVLFDGTREPGSYQATFAAGDLPSGVYFYRLDSGGQVRTRRMIIRK